ncbi:MAG TPA: enoyl-CoA hydratase/isomerase family protein [Ktedonobacterales bacterium]|nr:enoyl-CoA hydratase/isomerase family protein [Ktedonobacterales bacterium]
MQTTFTLLRMDITGDVATVTLNRPPLNILTTEMIRELDTALDEIAMNQHLKAVVLRAEGKAFCAGVDVADHVPERVDAMIRGFGRLFTHLRALPVPTIAVVQGAALGGGTELAIGCDIVLAASSARFGQPEVKLGVFPPIAAACFPQLLGYQQAAKLILTGATISAADAVRLHLATEVAPDEELSTRPDALLSQLRSASATTLRLTKRALLIGADRGVSAGLESIETLYLTDLMATADAAEGINAFMEKRPPAWRDA